MMKRVMLAVLVSLMLMISNVVVAEAGMQPRIPWVGTNRYIFAIGDSVLRDCGEDFGMGNAPSGRSLGFIGWPGADTRAMRDRLSQTTEGWSWTTESSNAEERTWFRDAGSLVIGLGTIDVKTMSAAEFQSNVDWFMQQSRGRPVEWFTIHNPPFEQQVVAFNNVLEAATVRWPNLRLLPWDAWADQNPGALIDGVHVADKTGCYARNDLIRMGSPAESSATAGPRGYWYPAPASTANWVNGWGAALLPAADSPVWINVRVNYQHHARYLITSPTSDLYAQAAGGRGFSFQVPRTGGLVSLDLVDSNGNFTALDSRII